MRFLPPDQPVQLYEEGFGEDILGRNALNKALSEILERIEDPLVIALDGRWGTGKSYFLKRWVGAHRRQNDGKALTVYFDAFAHDYLSDPLVSLVGSLSHRVPASEKPALDRLKKVAFKFARPAARLALAIGTYGASEALNGLGDAAAEAVSGEAEKAVDNFWKREEGRLAAMKEFLAALEALTAPSSQDEERTPVVIVIDELDRCRPDYALEILEVIKHFFAVPHVHFVLGANLNALENSIKVRYGPEIDATAYLQKFLSFTLSLPEHIGDSSQTPAVIKYVNVVGPQMGLPDHLLQELRTQLKLLARANHISIRDAGKILSNLALLPSGAQQQNLIVGYRKLTVSLVVTKVIRPDIFPKLAKASLRREELDAYLGASEGILSPQLDSGEPNPQFDREAMELHGLWRYVFSNGASEDANPWLDFGGYLDNFGRPNDTIQSLKYIYDNWVCTFEIK